MKRVIMSIDQIRAESGVTDNVGIMGLVDVENMGFCKDGVTRWYHFTNADGKPAVYFKY